MSYALGSDAGGDGNGVSPIMNGYAMASYGGDDDGLGSIFGTIAKFATGALKAVPIVGPLISGAQNVAGRGTSTGTAKPPQTFVQALVGEAAKQPAVQQAVVQAAQQPGVQSAFLSGIWQQYRTPILVGGAALAAVVVLPRLRRR